MNTGQFKPGESGNPAGRPSVAKGRLSFQLPIAHDPTARDLEEAISRITVEAASGKRELREAEYMIRILRQSIGAKHDVEKHDLQIKHALIRGMQTIVDHMAQQSAHFKPGGYSPEDLEELIAQAQAELDSFTAKQSGD